jgi:uncharacterized protein YhaN
MRLSELHIDGFGHFRDVSIGPFDCRVVILYGPNEAGKTTLLEFVRTMLFGFPNRYRDQYYPALAGGKHGGRLTLFDDAGARYMIERHAGPKGGLLSVKNEAGRELGQAALSTLLGDASADVFKNVFAFSLDELQSGALLKDEHVNGQIYSAGLGATRLPDAFKSLAVAKDRIYAPRGRNRIINDLLAELQDVDRELDAIRGQAAAFARLRAERDAIDAALAANRCESSALASQQGQLTRLEAAWDDWVDLDDSQAKLAAISDVNGFPEDAIARLETAEARVREAGKELQDAALQLEKARAAAAAEIPDAALLADSDVLADLNRRRSAFDDAIRSLPERQAELASLEGALSDRLRNLGSGWDEARLESFDASIEMRNAVNLWQAKLAEQATQVRKAQDHLQHQQSVGKNLQEAQSDAQSSLQHATPPQLTQQQIDARRTAIRACRSNLVTYERQQDNLARLQGQWHALHAQYPAGSNKSGRLGRPFAVMLIILGTAFLALGLALGQQASLVGIPAALVCIMLGGYMIVSTRQGTAGAIAADRIDLLRQQISEATGAAQQALQALQTSAANLQLDRLEAATLDEAETTLDHAQRSLDAWGILDDTLTQASRTVTRHHRRIAQAMDDLQHAESALQQLTEQWCNWLHERGLPTTYTPDTMVHFWVQADSARIALQRVRDGRRRVDAISGEIQHVRDLVQPLLRKHAIAAPSDDPAHLAVLADNLVQRLQAAHAAENRRAQARAQANEAEQHWQRRAAHLRQAEAERAELLQLGASDDSETFRRRALQCDKRRELERQIEAHLRRLRQLSGPGIQLETFLSELSQTDKKQIGDALHTLADKTGELDAQRSDLLQKRGETELRIEQLAAEKRASTLRMRRNVLLEQLREQARQWSCLRLAEALLTGAREKFQKERQPGVIQHAQRFFNTVTGDRYPRLYAPLGESTITVEDGNGVAKQPHDLSRGTREQLYLALRFGLIREFGQRAEPLPVIVDEVLVNFDPQRASRVAEAFAVLSDHNQVLVFTCHPTIRDMFTSAYQAAQVIDVNAVSSSSPSPAPGRGPG